MLLGVRQSPLLEHQSPNLQVLGPAPEEHKMSIAGNIPRTLHINTWVHSSVVSIVLSPSFLLAGIKLQSKVLSPAQLQKSWAEICGPPRSRDLVFAWLIFFFFGLLLTFLPCPTIMLWINHFSSFLAPNAFHLRLCTNETLGKGY